MAVEPNQGLGEHTLVMKMGVVVALADLPYTRNLIKATLKFLAVAPSNQICFSPKKISNLDHHSWFNHYET